MHRSIAFALCAVSAASLLPRASLAQSDGSPEAAALPASTWRVPLHRAEASSTAFWAAVERYKVRFEDGFELFPALGEAAPRHLPLRWRTERVTVGGTPLSLDAAVEAQAQAPWRLAFEQLGWTEVYDMLPEGLEQSFVFEERLEGAGDLVIRGRVETPLTASETAFAQQAIEFRDERGALVLRYGEGTVLDARGCSAPVASRWTGSHVELRVDGAWLASAAFPITVDPLTAPVDVNGTTGIGGTLSSIDICHHDRSATEDVLIAVTRAWTASDHDVIAVQCTATFASPQVVYSNLESAYSDTQISAAGVGLPTRWVIATQRDLAAGGGLSRIRLYVHDFTSSVLNSGALLATSTPAAESHALPQLGGTSWDQGGPLALLVFQSDAAPAGGGTDHSEARYATLDVSAMMLTDRGPCSATPVGTRYDRHTPSVNPVRRGNLDGWVVVWTELDRQAAAQDDWDLRGMRTDVLGVRAAEAELADQGGATDAFSPKVGGMFDDYLVCYGRSQVRGQAATSLRAFCFEWPLQQLTPSLETERLVGTANSLLAAPRCASVDFDWGTRSHWGIASTRRAYASGVWRTVADFSVVGGSAGTVESAVLFDVVGQSAVAPAVAYDRSTLDFYLAWGSSSGGAPARAARFERSSAAGAYILGTNCGVGTSISGSFAFAGNENFDLVLMNGEASQPAVLMLSAGPASLPLDALGLTGCTLYVDLGAGFASLATVTNAGGDATIVLPLPDAPVFIGDFYAQWVHRQPTANSLGFALTRGLKVQVR